MIPRFENCGKETGSFHKKSKNIPANRQTLTASIAKIRLQKGFGFKPSFL